MSWEWGSGVVARRRRAGSNGGRIVSHRILRHWVLSAVTGLAVGAGGPAHGQSVLPIVTKNAALRLPISLDERTRAEVSEVRLYVRGPAGRWVMVQSAPPSQATFDFKAQADGEYWFTFVTVDRRGRTSPANVETAPPHRIVVIDTKPAKAPAAEVRRDFDPVEPPPVRAGMDKGKPDPVRFPAVEPDPGRPAVVAPAGYDPTRPPDLPKLPPVSDPGIPDLRVPDLRVTDVAPPAVGAPDLKIPDIAVPPLPPTKPLDVKPPEPPPTPPDFKLPDPPTRATPTDLKLPDPLPKPASGLPDLPLPIPDLPAVQVPPPAPPRESTSLKPAEAPPGAKAAGGSHPVLNTRTCVINYESDGPVRVAARIDFWATKDGGRTWEPLRDEAGGIAPARLTLPGEGLFGIRIRPGAGSKPPEPGEEPDCVVEVDTTKPAVNLLQPTIGTGADEGTMLITWTAADKNLVSNSVNLFYATQSEGPWTEVARGYKNEGVYRWAMPTGLTGDIFVRLEATDRAGNVGRHDLNTPVTLDTGKGRVKVIGVGPAK